MKGPNAARLVALLLVVVAGFSYILFAVVGWRIGPQRFPVTVVLPRAGGIYPEADVTYRGVAVGKVVGLVVHPNDVAAQLSLDPGVRIPVDSAATVRELSAVGEQYLDLVPRRSDGPWLRAGSVLSGSQRSVPVSVNRVLIDFGELLSSISTSDIRTLNQGLSTGLGGAGEPLRTLIAQGKNLVDALRAAEPSTVELEVGGHAVLTTALATNNDFSQFSLALAQLTGQFRQSNPDVQALLTNSVAFENQFGQLLATDSRSIEGLVSSSATSLNVAAARNPAVQAFFQALPVFAGNLAAISSGGQIHSELLYNYGDTVCPYLPASSTPGPTQATGAPNLSLNCPISAPDLLQRGASHAPGLAGG